MSSVVTADALESGIEAWRSHERWRQDFHNALYIRLADARTLDDASCSYLVDRLWDWRAIRPKRKIDILDGLLLLRPEIRALMSAMTTASIETSNWDEVSALFVTASSVKGSLSPVFGSKLCHFLVPSVYPVIDRAVVGLRSREYRDYWEYSKEQWCAAPERQTLIKRLRREIGAECADGFPFATKITELCLIGARTWQT